MNFWLAELFLIVLGIMDCVIMYQFYKAKNGVLRKIMIGYFLIAAWVYLGAALCGALLHYNIIYVSLMTFSVIAVIPKVIITLILYKYLRTKTKQQ